jgi:hypothetical protein
MDHARPAEAIAVSSFRLVFYIFSQTQSGRRPHREPTRHRTVTSAMPLKICFINPLGYSLFFPESSGEDRFGGAEIQLYNIAVELAKDKEYEVTTLVEAPRHEELGTKASVRLLGVKPIHSLTGRLRARIPSLSWNYFQALDGADADVYVQRGGAVLTGEVGLFCRLRRRKFLFMSAHQWDCDRTHQRGRDWLCGRFYNFGLRSANCVLSQSGEHHQLLLQHYRLESQPFNIVYPEDQPEASGRKQTVLWVGRCLEWKQPELFLEIAGAFPLVNFVMVCPHQGGCRRVFDETKKLSQRHDNLTFEGRVPFPRIDRYFGEALVYVNTSIAEGFPNTFIQAARNGTPIVSLSVDPDGILERERIGFFCRGDLRVCIERVRNLLLDADLWTEYSANCRRHFRNNHMVSTQIDVFKRCLQTMLGK